MMRAFNSDNPSVFPEPDRLLDAADAILNAERQPGGGYVTMWRDDSRPASSGFSSQELVAAMVFLRRLGLVRESDPSDQGGRRAR